MVEIRYLADCPETIPQLAAWFRSEWPDAPGDAEDRWQRCASKDKIPIGLVAFRASAPIGAVAILKSSVHSHDHLEPWIGGLYVLPNERHQGVASQLIDAALDAARSRGVGIVYVGIQAARKYYEDRGWKYLEEGKAGDEPVLVLSKGVATNTGGSDE